MYNKKLNFKILRQYCFLFFLLFFSSIAVYSDPQEPIQETTDMVTKTIQIKKVMWIHNFRDQFSLNNFSGHEGLSQSFEYNLDLSLIAGAKPPKTDELLGTPITVVVQPENRKPRYFNGYISEVNYYPNKQIYTVTMAPWLQLLNNTANLEIFQEVTVPEIIRKVFLRYKFCDYELQLTKSYPKEEMCIQYRETDLNFVSRLLEHVGIYYYFKHSKNAHTLILTDNMQNHKFSPGGADFNLIEQDDLTKQEDEKMFPGNSISDWWYTYKIVPTSYTLKDYDFRISQPEKLCATASKKRIDKLHPFEMYDFPGEYNTIEDAAFYARLRLEEMQSDYVRVNGTSESLNIITGFLIRINDKTLSEKQYLITNTYPQYRQELDPYSFSRDKYYQFDVSFSAIPLSEVYIPPRLTPKPVTYGVQTAVVASSKPDIYGRVKVRFRWDRSSGKQLSGWIRIAQPFSGNPQQELQPGQEVLVHFIEGNPDRPVISGIFLSK